MKITNPTFWAKEFRIPLFILTEPNRKIFNNDMLFLYKDKMITFYGINEKEEEMATLGLSIFSELNSLENYKIEASLLKKEIDELCLYCESLKNSKLDKEALREAFFKVTKVITNYSNVYSKTEPLVLRELEKKDKNSTLVKELGIIRLSLRNDSQKLYFCLLGILFKKLANNYSCKSADLFFYSYNEIYELFEGRCLNAETINERSRGYALVLEDNKSKLLTGLHFKEILKKVQPKVSGITQFPGKVAMVGKVQGRVNIISHRKKSLVSEINSFKDGEILVTEMTRPDLIFVCKRAAGIVTDEGGISSHAAILAREFKVPCLVGTKIATKVLRTGDLIELDCTSGKVKIVERS